MAESETNVTIVQEKEKSKVQRVREFLGIGKTASSVRETDRFERLGLLQYPADQQLEFRTRVNAEARVKINRIYAEIYNKKLKLLTELEQVKTPKEKE